MRTTILAAALVVGWAGAAAADCTPDQIEGRWALSGSDNAKWVRCLFTVAPDGTYEGTCKGTGRPRRGNALDGSLSVSRTCTLSGTHRSGDQVKGQPLIGDLREDGESGSGILRFKCGPKGEEQDCGNLFTLTRKPE